MWMKIALVPSCLSLVLLLGSSAGQAKNEAAPWQSSFEAFAKTVESAAKGKKDLDGIFAQKSVKWTVTVEGIDKMKLSFKEAKPYAGHEPAIVVWVSLKKSEADKAKKLKPGDAVSVSGTIENVVLAESEGRHRIYISPYDCVIDTMPK